ncbi:hypothetical protein SUGI_0349220 [Cryptomeria japonica]|nr:hypothetical protein SUGI_0349220 [Cryptomeria japonica]
MLLLYEGVLLQVLAPGLDPSITGLPGGKAHFTYEWTGKRREPPKRRMLQGNSVKIGERDFTMSLSHVDQMVCGKELFEPSSAQATEFRGMGLISKTKILSQHFDNIYNRIIEERLGQRTDMQCSDNDVKDFLNVKFDWRENGTQLSLENIQLMLMISWIPSNNST